ncbi:hypothetical protein AB1N83_011325 [Pleurotus pulmonarius]
MTRECGHSPSHSALDGEYPTLAPSRTVWEGSLLSSSTRVSSLQRHMHIPLEVRHRRAAQARTPVSRTRLMSVAQRSSILPRALRSIVLSAAGLSAVRLRYTVNIFHSPYPPRADTTELRCAIRYDIAQIYTALARQTRGMVSCLSLA